MSVKEKIGEHVEFVVVTKLDDDEIVNAGKRAIEASKGVLGNGVKQTAATPNSVRYSVVSMLGIKNQADVMMSWRALGSDEREVTLSVDRYLTAQPSILFIPLSPKSAPALSILTKFSA